MSKSRVYLQRFLVAFLGLACAILGLELALRALGLAQRLGHAGLRPSNDAQVVLCLGDSYTACPGVSRDKTYPAQLEQQLNSDHPPQPFQVLNLGLLGQNSTSLRDELPDNLQKYRPDVVVLLTGGSNVWDLTGHQAFVQGKTGQSEVIDLLRRVRVYKLARLVFLELQGRSLGTEPKVAVAPPPVRPRESSEMTHQGCDALKGLDYATAERCFRQALAVNPREAQAWDGLAMLCAETSRFEEGIRAGEEAIRLAPDHAGYHDHLARLYGLARQRGKAIECLLCGLELGDDRYDAEEKVRLLQHLLFIASEEDRARIAERLHEIVSSRPQLKPLLSRSNPTDADTSRTVVDWVARDLEQIVQACQAQGVPVVLMNYPHDRFQELSALYERIARRQSLVFVDNQQSFQGLSAEQYYLPDGHCSELGNARVASNARQAILKVLGQSR